MVVVVGDAVVGDAVAAAAAACAGARHALGASMRKTSFETPQQQ